MRVTLPQGAMGLDLEDGTHYRARNLGDKPGTDRGDRAVEVTNPAHIAAIKRNPHLGITGCALGGDGWLCACRRGGYAWEERCPRCGRERPQAAPAEDVR